MAPSAVQERFGRYQLLAQLGRGGMADVSLGRLSGIGGFSRLVAIKRMLPHLSDEPGFVEMFLDEGRIAARLTHPNVCQVHELGEADGRLYLAMEYLDGLTWDELFPRLTRGGGFALRCTAGVLAPACDALHHAHTLTGVDGTPTPIVHRDVSPHNLFVTTDGICKVLDFGVSKVLTEGSRTKTGMIKGKLPYMAPEQIRGEPVDARADVFSMGVVLWESLTGRRLFLRDSDYQIWRAVTEDAIVPASSLDPDLPPAIDAVIARALERDRERRYPTIRELASALRAVAGAAGGALEPPAIAEVMRSLAAEPLAARHKLVGDALDKHGEHDATVPRGVAAATTRAFTDAGPTIDDAVALRDRSVAVRPAASRPRRWLPLAIAAGALAVVAIAVAWIATRPPPGTGAPAVTSPADASIAAAPADASPVASAPADAAPVARRAHERKRSPRAPPQPPPETGSRTATGEETGTGTYSVDSNPYATIYIDGKSFGDTPVFKAPLSAGKHEVRAVRADGVTKTFSIVIRSGKLTSSGKIAW